MAVLNKWLHHKAECRLSRLRSCLSLFQQPQAAKHVTGCNLSEVHAVSVVAVVNDAAKPEVGPLFFWRACVAVESDGQRKPPWVKEQTVDLL